MRLGGDSSQGAVIPTVELGNVSANPSPNPTPSLNPNPDLNPNPSPSPSPSPNPHQVLGTGMLPLLAAEAASW